MGKITLKENNMIYLGYDLCNLRAVAHYNGQTIICQESERAAEIINGLCDVAEPLPRPELISSGAGDVEVMFLPQTPYVYRVPYSDQAWKDLLSVEVARATA